MRWQDRFKALIQKYLAKAGKLKPAPADTPEPPIPPGSTPVPEVLTMEKGEYDIGISDNKELTGQIYFIPSPDFGNMVRSVSVGEVQFRREGSYIYKGRSTSIWYAKTPVDGQILVILNKGQRYKSRDHFLFSETQQPPDLPVGHSLYSYEYIGLTQNAKHPTWLIYGQLQVGQRVTFQAGPVTKTVTIGIRDNSSVGWDDGRNIIKNSHGFKDSIAVLIDPKYNNQHFTKDDCKVEIH